MFVTKQKVLTVGFKVVFSGCTRLKMSTRFRRKSKAITNVVDAETGVYEINNIAAGTETGASGVLLRIEEALGVPSPQNGVSTDLYWQVDVGSKRTTGGLAIITGSSEASSISALFHEDYMIHRATSDEPVLITLRSSALGNACFGKLVLDAATLSNNGEKSGRPGEALTLLTLPLVPYFKSNDESVVYDMQVRLIIKLVAPPVGLVPDNSVVALKQQIHIVPDPRGTLPGMPIRTIIGLRRSAGADKIAKGSVLIDTGGEAKVLVDGKIGKRRSFFSSGDAPGQVFPGIAAYLDSDSGIMERAAQEVIAKAAGNQQSNGSTSPKQSLAELSRSPRASQRASLLFKGAPKVTEFDDTAKTWLWSAQLPVLGSFNGAPLPPTSAFANDGNDIFQDLQKTMDVAFGIRHAITARCGLMTPNQVPFVVHPLNASNIAPVQIQAEGYSLTAKIVLDYSRASDPTVGVTKTLDLTYKLAAGSATQITITIHGSILIGDGAKGKEWKAYEQTIPNPTGGNVRQALTSSVFGPPAQAGVFSTSYFIEATIQAGSNEIKLVKTALPVEVVLPSELASANAQASQATEIDTLQMKSTVLASDCIIMDALYPGFDSPTIYNADGTPADFADIVGGGGFGASNNARAAEGQGKRKRGKSKAVEDSQRVEAAEVEPVVEQEASSAPFNDNA